MFSAQRKWLLIMIVASVLFLIQSGFTRDGCTRPLKPAVKTADFHDWHVIDTGTLLNYVTNSTFTTATGSNYQSFLVGRDDLSYPSMQWTPNGYANNHYLYFGRFLIGYNNDEIRFNTATSHDFRVVEGPDQTTISFSMTDDSAGVRKVGIRTISNTYAFKQNGISDFLIYEYLVINHSGKILEDLYVGFYMDGDISSAGGGTGDIGFWRDDNVDYYLGTDINGNPESITYMYDDDNPNISGDDTGGKLHPPESTGYFGTRVLSSPPTSDGQLANRQSGHQWWGW